MRRILSPKNRSGTTAFLMVASKKEKKALIGANWSPSISADQSPYCSELTGVDSILSTLAILVQHFKIKRRAITIALDCESVLKTCAGMNLSLFDQSALTSFKMFKTAR